MSTQPEPQTKAGRELLDRQSDPDWMDLDHAPKLAAILAIEAQATAAARAEVARQVRELRLARRYNPVALDAVLALLEDAAPRQPEPHSCVFPGCGLPDRLHGSPDGPTYSNHKYAAPRQPEPAHSTQCLAIGGGPGHDACVCYCHRTAGPCVVCGKPFPCPGFWESGLPHRPAAPDTTTGTTDE